MLFIHIHFHFSVYNMCCRVVHSHTRRSGRSLHTFHRVSWLMVSISGAVSMGRAWTRLVSRCATAL